MGGFVRYKVLGLGGKKKAGKAKDASSKAKDASSSFRRSAGPFVFLLASGTCILLLSPPRLSPP
jgi:hypothetical protein